METAPFSTLWASNEAQHFRLKPRKHRLRKLFRRYFDEARSAGAPLAASTTFWFGGAMLIETSTVEAANGQSGSVYDGEVDGTTQNADTWGGYGRGFWPHMDGTLWGDGYRCDGVRSASSLARAVPLPLPPYVPHRHLPCDQEASTDLNSAHSRPDPSLLANAATTNTVTGGS